MKGLKQKKPEIRSPRKKIPAKPALEVAEDDELRGRGRPRSAAIHMPIYDTMAQCAAATSIPLAALKDAKSKGCEAFRHGRVDLAGFIHWFFSRDVDDSTDWNKENKRLDALIKRVRLDELKKKVINFATVSGFLQGLVNGNFFGELDRIRQEFPPALKGRDEIAIEKHIADDVDRIKATLLSRMNQLQ